ncbi:MAG: hypothetical protein M1457_13615 [bacterium]|nr:hypothetical protein [bacterium]
MGNRTVWRWPGGRERAGYRLRLYTPAQIIRLLAGAGFEVAALCGDFAGEVFDSRRSDRMLVIARRIAV